jgi:[ribosomal protein S5]-alanine N-acetyltransferase
MARLDGKLISLQPLAESNAEELLALRIANRGFFEQWEPVRTDVDFALEAVRAEIAESISMKARDEAYVFGIFAGGALVGRIALSAVFRRAWQNANLGYYVAREHNGKGYATEAVRLTVGYAFGEAGLHRVQAAVIPRNAASARVVVKAGLRLEGRALRYLRINGAWEDHDIYAVTADE